MKEKKTIYFIMVLHPLNGWLRNGNAYLTRDEAKEWVPFVRRYWKGLKTKIAPFTYTMIDGKMSDKSKAILDKKFTLEPPK